MPERETVGEKSEGAEHKRLSIVERREIIAPPGYVSVYHAIDGEPGVTSQKLDSIDLFGLEPGHLDDVIKTSRTEDFLRRRQMVDDLRPDWTRELGISRDCSFAYPSLEVGNGLMGSAADRYRYEFTTDFSAQTKYPSYQELHPDRLREEGIFSQEDFKRALGDPEFARFIAKGEVLELKVDPTKCYVADMEYWTRMDFDLRYYSEAEAAEIAAKNYWGSLVRLDDFQKFYKWTSFDVESDPELNDPHEAGMGRFSLRRDAPVGLSAFYQEPEILITDPVPPELIRVLP